MVIMCMIGGDKDGSGDTSAEGAVGREFGFFKRAASWLMTGVGIPDRFRFRDGAFSTSSKWASGRTGASIFFVFAAVATLAALYPNISAS